MARKLRVEYPGAVFGSGIVPWLEEYLGRRAKGDAGKVALVARLRAETVITVKWIAERLQLAAPDHVNHLLYRRRKTDRNDQSI